MPTQLLSVGYPITILEDVVYALPSKAVFLKSDAALEVSVDNDTWAALTGATTGVEVVAGWVRCTSASTQVIIKSI